ncbi:MAG TPA: UDP-N-acetylmuramoyl-L-alanyl-D-glutamate--2,6-diaminopimelate ligase [Propionibacteriaceae bacterium]|nr:UDP-N-acetylmuramoyl-L-alanyl-D-glutamate--2,6-diaminopimelate ligase [Propionibacteriaceae bacterium]
MDTAPGPLRPSRIADRTLADVFAGTDVRVPVEAADLLVHGIQLDSRTVGAGELYVALPGTRTHGASFAAAAAGRGAIAVLTDAEGARLASGSGLPVCVSDDPRRDMALAAAVIFGSPTHDLLMLGLTGTNGKTTTAFLIEAGLHAAGMHVGSIGTIGFRLDGVDLASSRTTITTPESPDLQALMALMLERGATAIAMEVSSHALALQRVEGVGFDVAGFTNLGRDHMDFHPSVEHYFETKARLFEPHRCHVAVVNIDDEYGALLASRIASRGAPRLVTTGFSEAADYRIASWWVSGPGSVVSVETPDGAVELSLDMPGEYNVRNGVTALAMLDAAHVDRDAALAGLSHAQVPGRMEPVALGPDAPRVLVDFAHTPQAISSALSSIQGARVITVIGAGGDRDAEKRPQMGSAAVAGSDVVIITDDNPRTEDPASIRHAIAQGARDAVADAPAGSRASTAEVREQPGRREAIALALSLARPGDVVALLGKGHERGQEVAGQVLEFDDVEVTHECWAAHRQEQ